MGNRIFLVFIFACLFIFKSTSLQQKDLRLSQESQKGNLKSKNGINSHQLPKYQIYLDQPAHERYKQIIEDKKQLLGQFIDYLYTLKKFKYSIWIAKAIFSVVPEFLIIKYFGKETYSQYKGIADYSGRKVYQIVAYNYMYEIGAANDFCTSIALTQIQGNVTIKNGQNGQKQNIKLLARNLDYGFQQFLGQNTVRLDYYQNRSSSKPLYTILSHAGFVSSHTVLKYESENNFQFAMSLNQRKSGSYLQTVKRIVFDDCEPVFQLTNRIMKSNIQTTSELVELVSQSKSCSSFYFIISTKTGDNVLIEKNYGVGVHQIYIKNQTNRQNGQNPSFILQTNTDLDKKDPDGRRDQALEKINRVIKQNGFINLQNIEEILLQQPNFNDLTIMTALIDVQKGEIKAVVWENQQNFNRNFQDLKQMNQNIQ